jgi:hypothetical protein
MPLSRLSDAVASDGRINAGAMSSRIFLDDLQIEVWAKASVSSRNGQFTLHHIPGLRDGMAVVYEQRRFLIDNVREIGRREQMVLICRSIASEDEPRV